MISKIYLHFFRRYPWFILMNKKLNNVSLFQHRIKLPCDFFVVRFNPGPMKNNNKSRQLRSVLSGIGFESTYAALRSITLLGIERMYISLKL